MVNKYKEDLDKIEFSFSTLHQYEQCPYATYQKKICGETGINNAYAEIGSFGHGLNEKIFKHEMTVQEALNDCVENFEYNVCEYISETSKENKFAAMCDYLANFDETYEERYEILGVEKEFHWKIGKHKCVGYADLILRGKESNKVFLIDHKSAGHFMKKNGEPLKNQEDNFKAYSKQMYMYSDAMMKEYGFYPDYIVWNHFLDNSKTTVIPFNKEDLNSAIQWVKDTIKKIYSDTKFEPGEEDYTMCYLLCNFRDSCDYKELRKIEGE